MTDDAITSMRDTLQRNSDGSTDRKTTIFLSQYSIDDDLLEPVFFDDNEGIKIIIIPKEDLSEDEIMQSLTSTTVGSIEVNLNENLKGNLFSIGAGKDVWGRTNINSGLGLIDDENAVYIISSLNDDQLIRLGLALSSESPMR